MPSICPVHLIQTARKNIQPFILPVLSSSCIITDGREICSSEFERSGGLAAVLLEVHRWSAHRGGSESAADVGEIEGCAAVRDAGVWTADRPEEQGMSVALLRGRARRDTKRIVICELGRKREHRVRGRDLGLGRLAMVGLGRPNSAPNIVPSPPSARDRLDSTPPSTPKRVILQNKPPYKPTAMLAYINDAMEEEMNSGCLAVSRRERDLQGISSRIHLPLILVVCHMYRGFGQLHLAELAVVAPSADQGAGASLDFGSRGAKRRAIGSRAEASIQRQSRGSKGPENCP
ncbi:hypothetical protein BDK51DRAFT_44565 [Blyttiomyces helicus]|uniref:Uncharacterized protein n=1 Tax=Blyttiomyces helicus TaxID=388810 RepID=A0A4P9W759_9FUNG|nr:hypothetical protein BDK51DRAFT_44565 [Blyttiomyces helicus]|eukprot:RKO88184.1 hypothetical protein BDK51DRAFT_44565 [Blyttiomyces helicus]